VSVIISSEMCPQPWMFHLQIIFSNGFRVFLVGDSSYGPVAIHSE
jgi:hypothetical protein